MTEQALDGLSAALKYGGGTHTLEDVAAQIASGDAQVWAEADAMLVTEIHDTPRKRVLHFWLATGELKDVIALSHKVEDWGRDMGCTAATLTGRKGWERALRSEGWKPTLTVLQREL